jgi:hypothetical protein
MFLAAVTLATQIAGTWSISPAHSPADVQVELRYTLPSQDRNEGDEAISLAALGLHRADVDGRTHETQFTLNRDAGSIAFTGAIGDGVGAGHFAFSAVGGI